MPKNNSGERDQSDWEYIVTLELYKSYKTVLRAHSIKMHLPTLSLFDSESMWGMWNPLTRTLYISRRLVRDHSWYSVESILRHEMAHQMVDEVLKGTGTSHGSDFEYACRKLGVPAEFSKAEANLTQHSLDWKKTQIEKEPESESSRMSRKVEKLLALATSSNENESLSAMEKVRELYLKYNLENFEKRERRDFAHVVLSFGKKRIEADQQRITSILTSHFFVEAVYTDLFNPHKAEYERAVELIGSRENALMAEYVYHFLNHQLRFLTEDFEKKNGKLTRLSRKSFRIGILDGFSSKLEQKEKTDKQNYPSMQKALVKLKKDPKLESYLNERYPRLTNRKRSSVSIEVDSYASGQEKGKTINLHKGVSERSGNRGRLLT